MIEITKFKELKTAINNKIYIIDCNENNIVRKDFYIGLNVIIDNIVWRIIRMHNVSDENIACLVVD
jgi:hypothetical protein